MKGRMADANALRRLSDAYQLVPADERVGLAMPMDIAEDPVQSELWAELAPPTNNFTQEDEPNMRLLVYWHTVAAQAQHDLRMDNGAVNLDDLDTVRILKQASAEIRALSEMLGLSPLARSRIGLMRATTVKTAADTAAMFRSIDAAYGLPGGADA